jgi:hypothetical protein
MLPTAWAATPSCRTNHGQQTPPPPSINSHRFPPQFESPNCSKPITNPSLHTRKPLGGNLLTKFIYILNNLLIVIFSNLLLLFNISV